MRTFLFLFLIILGVFYSSPTTTTDVKERDGMMQDVFIPKQFDEQPTADADGWQLFWADEFNTNSLDKTKWTAEHAALVKNEELQFYSRENVTVNNGYLYLHSTAVPTENRPFTSGAVHTRNKMQFLYGKVEMRAKLPAGQGLFPAFWAMTVAENTWLPEIDIMEMLGHEPHKIWMVYHRLNDEGLLVSESETFYGEDFSKDFHTFGMEWTSESITWFIDQEPRFQLTTNIPNEPMFLYVNTAIGGVWPGSPDETTSFPVDFVIDYIRIYKKAEVK